MLRLLLSLSLLALLAWGGYEILRYPRIHDVSTDPEAPPRFRHAPRLEPNRGRDMSYPHGSARTPELQRRAYPDLAPVGISLPPGEALEAARRAAVECGWRITWEDREEGLLEGHDVTPVLRFVDDVVIRVRAQGNGSRVDVRSLSRLGVSDLGANARRIRHFRERLLVEAGG